MLLVAEPWLGEDEKAALADVVDSGWITMGDQVRAFELAFAEAHGASDAAAVSSCTGALHLAMAALDIGPGDEVLVPSLSFVATANSVLYAGAEPVFVDIESLDVPVISYADAAAKCTPRTKAVVVMHYGGYLVDPHRWRSFAQSHGLLLIEDAAHAVGLDRGPGAAAVYGDLAAFSFYGNKNMTTAEGGMIIAREPDMLDRVKQMRSHGMTTGTMQRLAGHDLTYDVTMLGYNYRMDELRAAVGLVQLRSLRQWNDRRAMLAATYRQLLQLRCPEVAVPFTSPRPSCHHIMPVVLPDGADRQLVADRLREAGIRTTVHYPAIHRFSWYQTHIASPRLPRTEEFCRRELTLPLHPKMDERDVEAVTLALAEALRR